MGSRISVSLAAGAWPSTRIPIPRGGWPTPDRPAHDGYRCARSRDVRPVRGPGAAATEAASWCSPTTPARRCALAAICSTTSRRSPGSIVRPGEAASKALQLGEMSVNGRNDLRMHHASSGRWNTEPRGVAATAPAIHRKRRPEPEAGTSRLMSTKVGQTAGLRANHDLERRLRDILCGQTRARSSAPRHSDHRGQTYGPCIHVAVVPWSHPVLNQPHSAMSHFGGSGPDPRGMAAHMALQHEPGAALSSHLKFTACGTMNSLQDDLDDPLMVVAGAVAHQHDPDAGLGVQAQDVEKPHPPPRCSTNGGAPAS